MTTRLGGEWRRWLVWSYGHDLLSDVRELAQERRVSKAIDRHHDDIASRPVRDCKWYSPPYGQTGQTTSNFYLARLVGALAPIVWPLPLKGDTHRQSGGWIICGPGQRVGARGRSTAGCQWEEGRENREGESEREREKRSRRRYRFIQIHRRCRWRKWVHGPALAIHRDTRLHRVMLCNGSSSLPLGLSVALSPARLPFPTRADVNSIIGRLFPPR